MQVRAAPPKPPPPPPQLSATRFVAFGDSMTEGFAQTCPGTLTLTWLDFLRDVQGVRRRRITDLVSEPACGALLTARYPNQTFNGDQRGQRRRTRPTARADLPRVLTQDTPQVLLLQEGTNDMDSIAFGANPDTEMTTVVNNLRTMIRAARSRGVTVFAGNLTPQRPGACRGYAPGVHRTGQRSDPVDGLGEESTLADIYGAFGSVAGADLIGPDGLHPTEAGYSKIADAFFDVIRQRLEN